MSRKVREVQITWVGHSTVVLDFGDVRVLTDPLLTARVAHLRRHAALDDMVHTGVDAVLISHVHHDHLHIPSLRRLPLDCTIVVPLGAARLLWSRGFTHVRETQPGETTQLGPVEVTTVPARHSGRRGPHSRITAPAVGYVLRANGLAVYFAGDTDLFPEMCDLAPVDVALLPIWGWGPTLGEGHLDPCRAAEAAVLIDALAVVPIHWGTYSPSIMRRRPPTWLSEPEARFRAELDRIGRLDRLRSLAPGEQLSLSGRE